LSFLSSLTKMIWNPMISQQINRIAGFLRPKDERKAAALKRYLKIGGIAVGVLIVLLLLLPFLIDVNRFRPQIEEKASAALGRHVSVGELSLSILSGNLGADTVSIAEDPAFGTSPFVTAKSLKVGIELMPLIFSKQLNVTHITLDEPQITLLKAANGKWNFSSIGKASQKPEAEPKASGGSPTNFSVAKLSVAHGRVLMGKANSTAKPIVYDDVNITVSDFSFTSKFPFQLTAKLPRSGDADLSGSAGPLNQADMSKTALEATMKVHGMNLDALGVIDPASGIAGVADLDGTLSSDGSRAKAAGVLTGNQLKFSPRGTPAPKSVTVKYVADYDLDNQRASIAEGHISIGKAQAQLTGTVDSAGNAPSMNLKLNAPSMPVDELEAMLPSMGIVLPSGSQLKGGTLSADLAITGPVNSPVITGPVRLSNVQLANFDLGSKLGALSAFTGKATSSRDTSIQNASLNARVAPEGTTLDNIAVNIPALASMTGNGTVSPAGALNFKMQANLQGGVAGGLTKVAGVPTGQNGIAFAIQGTTSDPKFVPDVGGIATGLAKGAVGNLVNAPKSGSDVAKGIGGLLKKKP
jgi:AsmA protein